MKNKQIKNIWKMQNKLALSYFTGYMYHSQTTWLQLSKWENG